MILHLQAEKNQVLALPSIGKHSVSARYGKQKTCIILMILCFITGYLLVSNLSGNVFFKYQRSTIICVAIKPSLAHLAIPLLFGHPELMWEEVKKILLIGVDAPPSAVTQTLTQPPPPPPSPSWSRSSCRSCYLLWQEDPELKSKS